MLSPRKGSSRRSDRTLIADERSAPTHIFGRSRRDGCRRQIGRPGLSSVPWKTPNGIVNTLMHFHQTSRLGVGAASSAALRVNTWCVSLARDPPGSRVIEPTKRAGRRFDSDLGPQKRREEDDKSHEEEGLAFWRSPRFSPSRRGRRLVRIHHVGCRLTRRARWNLDRVVLHGTAAGTAYPGQSQT